MLGSLNKLEAGRRGGGEDRKLKEMTGHNRRSVFPTLGTLANFRHFRHYLFLPCTVNRTPLFIPVNPVE